MMTQNEMTQYDLVVRGGTVVDGSGAEPKIADVAVRGGVIVDVGEIRGKGKEEIDAAGYLVTPGFVDIHTHYDGQAIWSEQLNPSSSHGVTTVIAGNCGVGFAPCRPSDHAKLVDLMEGVEDIPEIVMTKGLSWEWETFPQYLDALDRKAHDIDIGVYLPHSPLRVYVMGDRALSREPASENDIRQMRELLREAMEAGAMGFATSRILFHRTAQGELIPSFGAAWSELEGIGEAMRDAGSGVMQIAFTAYPDQLEGDIDIFADLSKTLGRPLMMNLSQFRERAACFGEAFDYMAGRNEAPGVDIKFQIFPRPVGMILSFELSNNPFRLCPSYAAIADLPIDQKLAALRKPEVRERLIDENPDTSTSPSFALARDFERMFPLGHEPNYEPKTSDSIASIAARQGRRPVEIAYDLLLEDEGRTMLYAAITNYAEGNLNFLEEYMPRSDALIALGDGGAHYGLICDSGYTTFLLAYWTRDRQGHRISITDAIHKLSRHNAEAVGLLDRGLVRPGYKADLNVIDYQHLRYLRPKVVFDLPDGARRIDQKAEGYVATVVSGTVIVRNDQPTGALPGRLVRGAKDGPSKTVAMAAA